VTPELADQFYGNGAWQHRVLHEIVDEIAERRPDALAVADQHERLTYAELVKRSHAAGCSTRASRPAPRSCCSRPTGSRSR
jgi:non-ribosomal peptide synthetase component E (peptide arylation enzyme)